MHAMRSCIEDLERNGHLVRIKAEIDPDLELAEIQRRAYLRQAPALFFENVKGTPFPCVTNLFGTQKRAEFIFRDTIALVEQAVRMKADPIAFAKHALKDIWKHPGVYLKLPFTGLASLPKKVGTGSAPVLKNQTQISQLPQIKSWPDDGGPFITLPQVYSEDPTDPHVMRSNLGMYRVQLGGNDYVYNKEIGIHYQIHRGMGIHHTHAQTLGQPLKASVFVGGHPAMTLAAVMPLPEGLTELLFAGMLAGRRFRYTRDRGHTIAAEADFCITGTIVGTKPEGPFGDHLGYYSLMHDFPVMQVDRVYHRDGAIWPFTVVGRPPQEDTTFGALIHELTGAMVPVSLPGVSELHAVDAAGVHPLLLAKGSERYVPYRKERPQELLTQANAILGFNQCSLAKYLIIADGNDPHCPKLSDIMAFLTYTLERINFQEDLHFQTRTTMDTLDYSGEGLNAGSKLVMASRGEKRRKLGTTLPKLPSGWTDPRLVMPGVVAVKAPPFVNYAESPRELEHASEQISGEGIALVVVCDDPEFTARNENNFLWTTFTRSNPSHDIYGRGATIEFKHWGCKGPLVIDARIKPHNAPPLVEDPQVTSRVDELAKAGGPLAGVI